MQDAVSTLMILAVLSNLAMLGITNLPMLIRLVGFQGMVLSLAPWLASAHGPGLQVALVTAAAFALKGVVFPAFLMRNLRRLKTLKAVEPYVGFGPSVFMGVAGLALSLWFADGLPLSGGEAAEFSVAAAFMTTLTGLLLLITRKKALTQVMGYLTAENGIFLFGAVVAPHSPILIELCILLDLFVAVFVMGIAVHHIRQEFDSIDVDLISDLKD